MTDDALKGLPIDPNNPDATNALMGVLMGRGTDEKTVRLYTTVQLNQFFQIPADRILAVKRFPMGQVVVWIPDDVKVQLTTVNTMSGDFLKGSIQAAHARRARGGFLAALGGQGGGGTSWGGCPTDLPGDPSCPIPTTSSPPLCGPNPPTGCRC